MDEGVSLDHVGEQEEQHGGYAREGRARAGERGDGQVDVCVGDGAGRVADGVGAAADVLV